MGSTSSDTSVVSPIIGFILRLIATVLGGAILRAYYLSYVTLHSQPSYHFSFSLMWIIVIYFPYLLLLYGIGGERLFRKFSFFRLIAGVLGALLMQYAYYDYITPQVHPSTALVQGHRVPLYIAAATLSIAFLSYSIGGQRLLRKIAPRWSE